MIIFADVVTLDSVHGSYRWDCPNTIFFLKHRASPRVRGCISQH
jgi:hypothetical protein